MDTCVFILLARDTDLKIAPGGKNPTLYRSVESQKGFYSRQAPWWRELLSPAHSFNVPCAGQLWLYNTGSGADAAVFGMGDYSWHARLMEAFWQMQPPLPGGGSRRGGHSPASCSAALPRHPLQLGWRWGPETERTLQWDTVLPLEQAAFQSNNSNKTQ